MKTLAFSVASKPTPPLFLNNLKNYFHNFLLIVCLLCGILNAEGMTSGSKDSAWQSYFGVEGGMGAMSFFQLFWLHSISL